MKTIKNYLKEFGTYIITGGIGGLGLIFAEYLVKTYNADLILVGRSAINKDQQRKIRELKSSGSRIIYIQCNIADRESVENLVFKIKSSVEKVNGVIHAAGVINDSYILNKTAGEIEEVISPKIQGTVNLDELLKDEPLDFFVMFSSISSLLGNVGQSDYAYANCFMDNYAMLREDLRSRGERQGRTISINWPLWEDGGFEVDEQTQVWLENNMGVSSLNIENGIKAFENALKVDSPCITITNNTNGKIESLLNQNTEIPLSQQEIVANKIQIREHNLSEKQLYEVTVRYLKNILSKISKIPVLKIKSNVSLDKYGIDSLMIVNLNRELELEFGKLSKTLFFEYQTLDELASYFVENHKEKLVKSESDTNEEIIDSVKVNKIKEATTTKQELLKKEEHEIAIIGLNGKYPMADNLEEFWENLKIGKDCIVEIPEARWDYKEYYDPDKNKLGKTYSKWGGFINDVDKFDPRFFNISPREAELMDPQERLFLNTVWHTLEDSGYTRESLNKNKVGVFVGAMYGQYQLLSRKEKQNDTFGSAFYSSIANRISYLFNFQGPSMAVDTMCSSSITTIHLACESILRGECELAIAGGVNVSIHPNKYTYLSRAKFLSSDGRCRSFGEGGDGYVPGEGVGAVLLKPLKKAIEDNDQIYGIIKGVSVNHGGKTNGYSVPNPNSQANLIKNVLLKANINPRAISYLEAHGTGTALGDPIEISGVTKAFREFTSSSQYCSIGSVKSNIGHLESSAGIASLTKVLLQMKHKQLVPSIHSDVKNSNIDFENSPFYVQNKLSEWKKPIVTEDGEKKEYPRIAGISSFGAGGSNAHLLIEEYENEKIKSFSVNFDPQIIVLSAKNKNRLEVYAKRLLEFLEKKSNESLYVPDIAFTLQVGREAMNERLAFVVSDLDDLLLKLKSFCKGTQEVEVLNGSVKRDIEKLELILEGKNEETLYNNMIVDKNYLQLARLWTYGADIDWESLYNDTNNPNRISLPVYPFLKESYWIKNGNQLFQETTGSHLDTKALHPFIHSNSSTFEEQKFITNFKGTEDILSNHIVNDKKTLPGSVYLEMARFSGEYSQGKKVKKIKNILWNKPLIIEDSHVLTYTTLVKDRDCIKYEINTVDKIDEKSKHASGELVLETERVENFENRSILDIENIQSDLTNNKTHEEIYQEFDEVGIKYRGDFKVIKELFYDDKSVVSYIKLPEFSSGNYENSILNPLVIDGAFQTATPILGNSPREIYLPYSIKEIEIIKPLVDYEFYVYVNLVERKNGSSKVDVWITNKQGEALVKINDLSFQKLSNHKLQLTQRVEEKSKPLYFGKRLKKLNLETSYDEELYTGPVLIIDKDELFYNALVTKYSLLGKDSSNIILLKSSENYRKVKDCIYEIDIRSIDDYYRVFDELSYSEPMKIIYLLSYHSEYYGKSDLTYQLDVGLYPLFYITKVLLQANFKDKIQLIYAYQSNDEIINPENAGVSGFIKSASKEYKKYTGKVVQIKVPKGITVASSDLIDIIFPEFKDNNDEILIDYLTQNRFVIKFDEITPLENNYDSKMILKENGVYLITGGAGELGLIFAEYLAKKVKAKLVLIGRSNLNSEKVEKLRKIEVMGSEVLYIKGDVFNKNDMLNALNKIKSTFNQLDGVIHSAGSIRDSLIKAKEVEDFEEVLKPKVHGSIILDEVTQYEKLDFFVLFSSVTGVMGNFGQSDYAYANAFMDNFAERREKLKLKGLRYGKTISLNWPLWADGGMNVKKETIKLLTKTMGTNVMDKETGLHAFSSALSMNETQLLVLRGNREQIKKRLGLFNKDLEQHTSNITIAEDDNKERIIKDIQRQFVKFISEVLKLQEKDIEIDEGFDSFGFDSITITEIVNLINEKYDLEVTPADFYEYSSVESFATNLYEEYKGKFINLYTDKYSQKVNKQISVKKKNDDYKKSNQPVLINQYKEVDNSYSEYNEPVAVIGMSGQLAQSENLEEFWNHLEKGKDLITEIPKDRWDWGNYYGDAHEEKNKTNVKWGGFINEVDKFDADFFGISPHEAKLMDPQQRIFLENVWKTIENAGYKASDFSGTNTGVFVGVSNMDYYEILNKYQDEIEAHVPTGNSHSILSNRISYLLNLHGPSEPINTACSSSLVAIHKAVKAIQSGECNIAIAGGVNIILSPRLYISFDKAGMLSPDGRCKTFDNSANGYVRGEGCGALLLKSLSQAEADGDNIYAVIRGSAVNHGGRTNSLTVPNPNAQAKVIIDAFKNARVNPTEISYIEAHGTGTPLGDPIEINGLKKAFNKLVKEDGKTISNKPYCGIGSVKTNIGHLESAAGIAGVFKVLLAMRHKKIPKSLHLKEINPYIKLDNSPFYINNETKDWNRFKNNEGIEIPRMAGISSFGFGGVNAHLILEEYEADSAKESKSTNTTEQIFVLSAKNPERLKSYSKKILNFLKNSSVNESTNFHYKDVIYKKFQYDILEAVSNILNVDINDLSLNDELLDLGLDLVNLTRLIKVLNAKYNIDININLFLECHNLELITSSLYAAYEEKIIEYHKPNKENESFISTTNISLSDLCYTLQVGRESMKSRIAFIVSDIKELVEKLTLYIKGHEDIKSCFRNELGNFDSNFDAKIISKDMYLEGITSAPQLKTIAELWINGVDIDWKGLYNEGKGIQRIPLPTYPFERKSYWIDYNASSKEIIQLTENTISKKNNNHLKQKTFILRKSFHKVALNSKDTRDLIERITNILVTVLSVERNQIHADVPFTEMGMDSILGIKFIKLLNKEFQLKINPVKVIENPTLTQMSKYIYNYTGLIMKK
ncbi:SDR family NAD(P)-dependent oxidoreductase [Bacillus sp. FJAT-26377]|nr:SDR family NAD(P)-dependent oxidoreductase [Bacillus sp. FJAT-26377]